MIEFFVKVVLSYLLGSIIGSLVVGRLYGGVDIRKEGSGNAGATNALRTRGKMFAVWVLLIDLLKGWIAVRFISPKTFGPAPAEAGAFLSWFHWLQWSTVACAIAVIIGHVYPLWHGFRGGKGVATVVGVVVGLNPQLLLPLLATWLISVMLFGYVGLASMIATLSLPVAAIIGMRAYSPFSAFPVTGQRIPMLQESSAIDLQLLAFGIAAAALIAFTHRSNIARMRAGTEPRVRKLWLFRGKRA
ncbi:MAG TPA: glycerol-3-phosphate 1-O-acyltransferase PlsY [Steroidobacteraceae bacterium]